MKINLIIVEGGAKEMPFVVDAWDEYSMEENDTGFDEALKEAQATHVDRAVRVLTVEVPDDVVNNLFKVPVVKATIVG